MAGKKFDQRFGHALEQLPHTPGVYTFFNLENEIVYVGKAKNLKRRILQYRNAKRCKAHAKMKKIVADAHRLEYQTCATELDALVLENQLIQKHKPRWNVSGAFYFLYPMLGILRSNDQLYLCYTTTPENHSQFKMHGAFRSRQRTAEAFFALIELLKLIGHSISRTQLIKDGIAGVPKKYEYVYGFRQIPEAWSKKLSALFQGQDFTAVEELSILLLEKPTAIARAEETQTQLREIRKFWRHEILKLKQAKERVGYEAYPVAQKDRDLIFIHHKYEKN